MQQSNTLWGLMPDVSAVPLTPYSIFHIPSKNGKLSATNLCNHLKSVY